MATKWITIAEGTKIDTLEATIADMDLKKGTPIRFEMELSVPLAHFFNLSWAEWIFEQAVPDDIIVKDVHSPDSKYQVVVECESGGAWILAIVAFVRAHWLALSLISIGIVLALGYLVTAIKIKAEVAWIPPTYLFIAVIAVIILVGYLAYKGSMPIPAGR